MQKLISLLLILCACAHAEIPERKDSGPKVYSTEPAGGVCLPPPGDVVTVTRTGRHIRYDGPINPDGARAFVALLKGLTGGSPIVVSINSRGGLTGAGEAMVLALEHAATRTRVVCVADGVAFSMAFNILQSCDVRVATEATLLTYHNAYQIQSMNENDAARLKAWNHQLNLFVASRSKVSLEAIETKLARGDWDMSAQEALRHGFVDHLAEQLGDVLGAELDSP